MKCKATIRGALVGAALIAAVMSMGAMSAQGAVFYVDPAGGSMSNPGTEASPWPSLQTVAASGRQFAAGDVLILMAGHHGSPRLVNANAGYVTVRPKEGARATLRSLSFASSARFWRVQGLEISPETSSSYGRVALIEMSASCDNIVEGCQAYSVKDSTGWSAADWRTITCDALNASGSRNTIRSNTFRNVYWGIQVGGDHNLIQCNTVDRFSGDGLRGNGNYLTFEYNLVKNHFTVDDNHPDGFQAWTTGSGGVGTGVLRGNVLRGNVIIECDDPTLPFRGGLEGIGCFDGFYEDWVVENNVIVVDTWHGIAFYGARNCKFINNTVVDINRTGAGPAWLMVTAHKNGTPSTGNLVRNNLTSDLAIDTGAATVDHNLKTTAYETHFVNWAGQNLRLRAGSPAIDAGSSNQVPAADALGVARPIDGNSDGLAAWDLGAYEYVSGAPTVSLTAPANGATYTAPASVVIQATAADADGTIAKVEFFNGATKLGEDTTSPYAYTWSSVVAGAYTLTAKATDNSGASTTSAGVNITVTSSSVNQPPVANAQSVTTAADTAKAITLTGSDPEGSNLTYAIVANPAHGTLTGTGASRTYTPAVNYSGSDSFTFKVNDGTLDSTPATVAITVTTSGASVRAAPIKGVVKDSATGLPLSGVTVKVKGTSNSTTTDANGRFTLSLDSPDIVTPPASQSVTAGQTATFTVDATGAFPLAYRWQTNSVNIAGATNASYTTPAVTMADSGKAFRVIIANSLGSVTSSVATLTVLSPDNTPPTVSLTAPAAGATVSNTVTVSATASDNQSVAGVQFKLDGANLGAEDTSSPYSISWDTWTAANGSHALQAVARDTAGNAKTSTAVNVTVTNAAGALTVASSSPAAVKGNTATLTTASFTPPAGAMLYILFASQQAVSGITDNLGAHLPYTLQATYGNSGGGDAMVCLYTAPVTVSQAMTLSVTQAAGQYAMLKVLVITGADHDAPVGAKGGGRGVTGVVSDTYASTAAGSLGWLLYADWTQKSIPTAGANQSVYDSYTVAGEDTYAIIRRTGVTPTVGASVTMNTTAPTTGAQISHLYFEMRPGVASPANHAPTVTANGSPASGTAPMVVSFTAIGSDVDGDTLSYSWAFGDSGTASTQNPSHTYASAGTYTATVTVSDGKGGTASANVTISVTAKLNQPPVATAQSVTTAEDTAKAITLVATDPDGDALTYSIVTQPAHGTLAGTGASRTYTPTVNYSGSDSFVFKVNDGALDSTPATVSITVTAVNDAPTCALTAPANGATYTAPASISIQATAADVDGTIAKVEFFNGATKLGEDTTSPYAYAWSNVAAGAYTLTAKATDNSGAITTSATRSVTVTAVSNQPPVVSFTRPSNGAQFPTGSTVSVTVSAVDPGGSIANVKLYLNGQFVRQENVVPYTWGESGQNDVLLTRMAAGTYTLEAVATDNGGATRSATIQIAVIAANQPPVAMAGVNPTSGSVTNEFYFWGTDSYDPDGTIVAYAWQIAGTQVSTNIEFLHTFVTGGTHSVTLTVRDNAGASDSDVVVVNVSESVLPVVSVAVSDATAGEPGLAEGTGKFLVSRSGDLTQAISVRYAMSGTASNGMDFTKLSGTVTLATGKSSASVTLTPLADAADEPDETAILTLLPGTGYTVDGARSVGTVTIKDQTYGTPIVSVVATDTAAVEPGVTVNKGAIKVSRTGSCHAALTVSCVMGGTAVNGVDYTTVTVPVTLAIGQSAKTLTITPLADAVVDSNETATLTIQEIAAYQIGAGQASATVTIADTTQLATPTLSVVATDPTALEPTNGVVNTGTFTFRRTSRFHEALVVNYTVGGTASNSVDYNTLSATVTIPVGVATKTLTVITKADGVAEGPETVIVSISASSAYIIASGNGAATVTITGTSVNNAPTCALTAPANGATYTAPASITLQATAADADGTIAKVEFFNGATKLGEDTTTPYAYTWSSVAAGSYMLTVKATDNSGASTTSAGVNITVTVASGLPFPTGWNDPLFNAAATNVQAFISVSQGQVVENVTLDKGGVSGAAGSCLDVYSDCTVRRVRINAREGVRGAFGNVNVSWLYAQVFANAAAADHADAWQNYAPGVGPNDSTIYLKNSHLRCSTTAGSNAAFFTGDWMGRIVMEDVWLAGGGYTLYLPANGATSVDLKNVYIEENSWVYGPLYPASTWPTIIRWENVCIARIVNGQIEVVRQIPRPY